MLDETVIVNHSDDMFAPVGLLRVAKCHTEPKDPTPAAAAASASPPTAATTTAASTTNNPTTNPTTDIDIDIVPGLGKGRIQEVGGWW